MDDFLLIDQELGDEGRLLRESIRRFVDKEALPLLPDAFERGVFPPEFIPKLANLGLLGMSLPEQYGGSDASAVNYGVACQELERGDSGIRSFVSVQSSLCMYPIYRYGSEALREQYLPRMAKGEVIGCFGLTEPDQGSDPSEMKTVAKPVKGGWVLNGSKLWITNAPIADIAIIWAKLDGEIRGFVVDMHAEGVAAHEMKMKLSLRASSTGEIVLTDCFVPEDHLLPGSDKGLGAPLSCLNQARFGIAWGAIGAAMACYEAALDYCQHRKQFGRPIAGFQMVQKDLVDMLTEITKAQCLNLHIAHLKDAGQSNPAMISMAKMNACREALKIARSARNLLGANGISLEYPVIRHMNNLEAVFTYEGTDNIHHLIIGKTITGCNAFN